MNTKNIVLLTLLSISGCLYSSEQQPYISNPFGRRPLVIDDQPEQEINTPSLQSLIAYDSLTNDPTISISTGQTANDSFFLLNSLNDSTEQARSMTRFYIGKLEQQEQANKQLSTDITILKEQQNKVATELAAENSQLKEQLEQSKQQTQQLLLQLQRSKASTSPAQFSSRPQSTATTEQSTPSPQPLLATRNAITPLSLPYTPDQSRQSSSHSHATSSPYQFSHQSSPRPRSNGTQYPYMTLAQQALSVRLNTAQQEQQQQHALKSPYNGQTLHNSAYMQQNAIVPFTLPYHILQGQNLLQTHPNQLPQGYAYAPFCPFRSVAESPRIQGNGNSPYSNHFTQPPK